MDPGFSKSLGRIQIHWRTWRHANLQLLELATSLCAGLAEAFDALASAIDIQREAVPSPRQPRCATVGLGRVASEHYLRMRLLDRTRHRIDALEADPSAGKLRLFHRPQRDHRRQKFLAPGSLVVERRPYRVELRLQIADADAEDEPAFREHVE